MKEIKENLFLGINECSNAFESVNAHRLQNPKNVIIGHLNVNSFRNKTIAVEEFMQYKVGICHGYKMYLRDRNKHGGGVLCYLFFVICYFNENIPCKMVSVEGVPDYCEITLIEFSIKT